MPEDPSGAGTAPEGAAATVTDPAAPDDRTPEEVLADAVSGAGETGTDPSAQLAAAQAEIKKWRDLSRQNESKAKANADAARKLAEIEDANKTEVQRAADRAAAAEQRAVQAERLYQRTLAAAAYDLHPSLIDAITGSTEDEINASAEKLAAAVNERVAEQVTARLAAAGANAGGNGPAQPGSRPQRPVESMRPGGMPAGASAPTTPDEWIRSGWNR